LLAYLFSGATRPARAATFDIADGDVTALKAAINASNSNGEDDVVNLAVGGVYTITSVDNTAFGNTGLPVLTSDGGHTLTINGRGSSIACDSSIILAACRILLVDAGVQASLDTLTLSGGSGDGGAASNNGSLTLRNCTVTDNSTGGSGGAFVNGLGVTDSTLTLINCTVTGNSAWYGGGAIYNASYMGTALVKIINCTISGNSSLFDPGDGIFNNASNGGQAVVQMGNTIMANHGSNVYNYYGQMQTLGHNVATDDCGIHPPGPGDVLGVNPLLDPSGLRDNGGPTKTILILPNSPALDVGDNSLAPPTDQRSVARPQPAGGSSDAGAVELRRVGLSVTLHTASGTPIPNAVVSLITTTGTTLRTAQSSTNGVAFFGGVIEGNYVVKPTHDTYSFAPASRTVTLRSTTGTADFVGTFVYAVTGRVVDAQGTPINGVTISAQGTSSSTYDTTTTTNGGGSYLLKVPAGSYTLTPAKTNYTFAPASRSVSITTNSANQNFTGATCYSISGRVTNSQGNGLFNVAITCSGHIGTRVTNTTGYYSIIGLQPGTYTITPIRTGYRFVPASRTVTITNANVALQDFRGYAGYSISGRITLNGSGLQSVTVKRSGSNVAVQTNSAGYYTFTDVPDGTVTITPSMSGNAFTPESRTVTMDGADISGQNFTAAPGYLIHGRIATSSGVAIAGAIVTRSGGPAGSSSVTATTNSAGYYSFSNTPAGTYTLTPNKSGLAFTPSDKTVAITNADALGQNFIGG
jgi:hypothetical protein